MHTYGKKSGPRCPLGGQFWYLAIGREGGNAFFPQLQTAFWDPLRFFGAGGTIDLKGGGLRPSPAAYGFTFVSGFHSHVLAHAEAVCSRFVAAARWLIDCLFPNKVVVLHNHFAYLVAIWPPFWYLEILADVR